MIENVEDVWIMLGSFDESTENHGNRGSIPSWMEQLDCAPSGVVDVNL